MFTTQTGKMLHRNSVCDRLQRVCGKLGVEDVNLHTFRHTCASRLIMTGVGLSTVGKPGAYEYSDDTDLCAPNG